MARLPSLVVAWAFHPTISGGKGASRASATCLLHTLTPVAGVGKAEVGAAVAGLRPLRWPGLAAPLGDLAVDVAGAAPLTPLPLPTVACFVWLRQSLTNSTCTQVESSNSSQSHVQCLSASV